MRSRARGLERFDQARGAHQVGLRGEIGGVVELDCGSRVDDDVARADERAALFAEAEPVASEVELEHRELLLGELGERRLAQLVLQTLERRARQHLALEALGGRSARARTDREVDAAALGNRAPAFLYQRFAQEAPAATDQHGLAL